MNKRALAQVLALSSPLFPAELHSSHLDLFLKPSSSGVAKDVGEDSGVERADSRAGGAEFIISEEQGWLSLECC